MKRGFTLIIASLTFAANSLWAANEYKGHEYVDLGLPSGTLWATYNVGAEGLYQSGGFYAWGELEGQKADYTWGSYKWGSGTTTLRKYCDYSHGFNGYSDTKVVLDPEDDVVQVNWEGGWMMPTAEQMNELFDSENCTYTLSDLGCTVKSLTNGAELFLPMGGYRNAYAHDGIGSGIDVGYYDPEVDRSTGFVGAYYWTSSLSQDDPSKAVALKARINSGGQTLEVSDYSRIGGFCVRPVFMPVPLAVNISTIDFGGAKKGGVAETIQLNVVGMGLTETIKYETKGAGVVVSGSLTLEGGTLAVTFDTENVGPLKDTITITSGTNVLRVPVKAMVYLHYADVYHADGSGFERRGFVNEDDLYELIINEDNTIFDFSGEDIPEDWAELPNVLTEDRLGNKQAKTISLHNRGGNYIYPRKIQAEYAEFLLFPTIYADKEKGWMSVALPFTGTPNIAPIVNSDKASGKYWVKKFVNSTESALVFSNLDDAVFEANVPYLFAFPSDYYGEYRFADKYLKVTAENVEVASNKTITTSGSGIDMTTVYDDHFNLNSTPAVSYTLNSETNMFERVELGGKSTPFSAYARLNQFILSAPALRSLSIIDADGYTDVASLAADASLRVYAENGDIVISATSAGVVGVCDVAGRCVGSPVKYDAGLTRISGLDAGMYIVAGQKVVLAK